MKSLTIWDRLGRAVRDRSFIIGSILVSIFVLLAVLGPEVAPHNPFMRDRVQTIDGEMMLAPFPPCQLYPLGTDDQGRDMLSLLLYGARQTLVIAFVAMVMRLLLGLLLGTLSGWWPGSVFDRIVLAITEFLAAIPSLILAILLVFAIGIHRGQITFIIALSLVGWGEIAQIIRGHVIGIRNKLFILASRAVGLGSSEIMSRHVLPNLLPTMLALAALEMGGVLLVLGELGFLHIFIGGGGIYVTDAVQMGQVVHYFEIPDWGAMLGTMWSYFRSMPWLPLAPALAFFVAILGFNLFGYGLQRFIEKGRFHPSGWSVVRFLVVVGVLLFGARSLLASSSLEAQFADLASEFDTQRAWDDISYLTHPALQGRPTGPDGGHQAAGYIAQEFEASGLTPLTNGTYFQSHSADVGHVITPPSLEIVGGSRALYYAIGSGLSFDPLEPFSATRDTDLELLVLANSPRQDFAEDASQVALLMLGLEQQPPGMYGAWHWGAVLRMIPDDQLETSRYEPPTASFYGINSHPELLIGESAVREICDEAGLDFDELVQTFQAGEEIIIPTGLSAHLRTEVSYRAVNGVNVVGYLPAADRQTEGDRVLVMARYSGIPPSDEGIYPGADDNASGVAVMLEIARTWRNLGFEPKRTVVFAAVDEGGDRYFGNRPVLPTRPEDTWTTIIIDGVGAGTDRLYRLEAGAGLARSFDDSASRFGVRTERLDTWRFFFVPARGRGIAYASFFEPNPGYSGLVVTRPGDNRSGTRLDTLDHLDPIMVSEAGKAIGHFLMVVSSR